MLQQERQNIILNQLHIHHKVVTTDLCKLLKVSLDTVRRDLTELERGGKVVKVHGGAISTSYQTPFQQPNVYKKEEKKIIGRKALSILKEGMIILGGGGTIMLELARLMPKNFRATFFTVSPLVALELTQRSSINVILLGGSLRRDSYICTGAAVITQLADIRADICLLGTNGLTAKAVSERDWEVAQVKKAMLKSSARTALLSLSEIFGIEQKMQVCKFSEIDYLITESSPEDLRIDLPPHLKRM